MDRPGARLIIWLPSLCVRWQAAAEFARRQFAFKCGIFLTVMRGCERMEHGERLSKQFGDTPNHSAPSLCMTCRESIIIEGQRDRVILCNATRGMMPMPVPPVVTACNQYDDKRQPPMWEMEKIAWRISADTTSRKAGFNAEPKIDILSPAEHKQKHPHDD